MSDSITRLAGRVKEHYYNNGHLLYLDGDLHAIASLANYVANQSVQALASANAAGAYLALMQAFGVLAYAIGPTSMALPRVSDLGSAAFGDAQYSTGIVVSQQNAAYQMTVHDYGKLLLDTSGTNTYTLPLATDLPDGWWCMGQNFSGANLTWARSGSDTINNAATSVTTASGEAIVTVVRRSSSLFLIG